VAARVSRHPGDHGVGRQRGIARPVPRPARRQILARKLPSARLWVIGEGRLLRPLRADAPSAVEFLGRVSLRVRLARAHVLVTTSVREGWGLNVSEAAACGTPSIGYRVPGLVDSLEASGRTVVDATPAALAQSLTAFFEGSFDLRPRISTLPWPDVAAAVEQRLVEVAGR
jgi:glycosyltransferase involved in cell wall biosynthesis